MEALPVRFTIDLPLDRASSLLRRELEREGFVVAGSVQPEGEDQDGRPASLALYAYHGPTMQAASRADRRVGLYMLCAVTIRPAGQGASEVQGISPNQLAGVWGGRRLEQHAVAQRQLFERALSRLEFDYAPADSASSLRRKAA
ncbi:MAG TPA: hypothetical protein PK956_02690 [Burkholderiaceae bacterium]|nr:hypothetical protein [Burkholderiaceae bacterium]HRA77690.1 hypothetical protein [Burkholderiaceae bacterium]